MRSEVTTASRWDALHEQERHRLRYPSEHVVRFLSQFDPSERSLLDIGCGSGRHLQIAKDMGFFAYGCDASNAAVCESREVGAAGGVHLCPMTGLKFMGGMFDIALAYGVFYYATPETADQAVEQMHRVLRIGGHGFVCVRSTRDWRADHIGHDGVFRLDGDPEDGMQIDFISEDDLNDVYRIFSEVRYEISEWTTHDRDRLNSDWLITVTK